MLDKKRLAVLKSVIKRNSIRPIVENIGVIKGVATATSLTDTIQTTTSLKDGLYDAATGLELISKEIDVEDFPIIPDDFYRLILILDIEQLRKDLKVHKNHMIEETPLLLDIQASKVVIVSTNSFCMLKTNCYTCNIKQEQQLILRKDTVKALEKILAYEKNGNLRIHELHSNLTFETDNFKLISRQSTGVLYDYKEIYTLRQRKHTNNIVSFNKKEMVEKLKMVLQVSRTAENKYLASFEIFKTHINITTKNQNVTHKTSITSKTIQAIEYLKIGLNVKFISDFVKNIDSNSIYFWYTTEANAITLKTENAEFLVMPMLISE